jgi:hypothetical protein
MAKLSRRTALTALAGAAAAGITPAIAATEPDPVFGLIERRRAVLEIQDEAHEHFEAMNAPYLREEAPEEFWTWPWSKDTHGRGRRSPAPREIRGMSHTIAGTISATSLPKPTHVSQWRWLSLDMPYRSSREVLAGSTPAAIRRLQ